MSRILILISFFIIVSLFVGVFNITTFLVKSITNGMNAIVRKMKRE